MSAPPSFSSFPPSFSSFPDTDAGPSNLRKSSSKDKEKERDKSGKQKKSKHESRRLKSHRHDKSEAQEERLGQNRDVEELSTSRFFYSDTRGDPLNVKYGSLHAGDIPKYHVVGRKLCSALICLN